MKKRLGVEYSTEEDLEHFIGMAGYDNIKVNVLAEQKSEFCECSKPKRDVYDNRKEKCVITDICVKCGKLLKPKKKLEKLSDALHSLPIVNQLRDKIDEIIDRINERR